MASPFLSVGVPLSGARVRLEPLRTGHTLALIQAAQDTKIFRWFAQRMDSREAIQAWVEAALAEQHRGVSVAYATVVPTSGEVIGSTRFMNIDRAHRRVEIGNTWIVPAQQRSGLNREAKFLMLTLAFESWQMRRVEFKTHHQNAQSRTALAALGAIEEGTLRKHMVMPDGSARDSVYFSILDDEWPNVRAALAAQLNAPTRP